MNADVHAQLSEALALNQELRSNIRALANSHVWWTQAADMMGVALERLIEEIARVTDAPGGSYEYAKSELAQAVRRATSVPPPAMHDLGEPNERGEYPGLTGFFDHRTGQTIDNPREPGNPRGDSPAGSPESLPPGL